MIIYYMLSFILCLVGIILIMKLSPEQVAEDVMKLTAHEPTLAERVRIAKGDKSKNRVRQELMRMKTAMAVMGKERLFTVIVVASLLLMVVGCVAALAVSNPFLLPVLAIAFAIIPFAYAKKLISDYDRQVKEELETALSIITTSYVRNDDIVTAVRENVGYLKPPVRNLFESFVTECTVITPNIREAIKRLKSSIKDRIFEEWCDTLLTCQDDRTLKDTLMPVVAKYTDVRIVNNDLKTMMAAVKWEYLMMVVLVLANIPILKLLNEDWYLALVDTIPGKLVLAVCAVTIAITAWLMYGYTRPVEFER